MASAGSGKRPSGSGALLLLAVVGLSVALPLLDVLPWRHVSVLPVLVMALRFGVVAGGLAGGLVPLAQAPGWLSQLETGGMTAAVVDEVIGSVTMLGIAFLVAVLAAAARRQRSRYDTLLAIRRVVAEERPLTETLERLRPLLAERCGAAALALVVRGADGLAMAGGERVVAGSAAARALVSGKPVFVSDTGTDARPRRAFAVPLLAQGEAIGVLALERLGELGSGERASLIELGASLGLALENARLDAVRRRFNAELSEKVAAATERLERLDRAKSTFVATVSHELRTPLTALLGFSELLSTRRVAADEVTRLAGIMRTEGERLARIVDDLLDLSRLEHGMALRVRPVPVAVGPALQTAVQVFQRPGVRHRIVVAEVVEACVRADPDALDRVVKNVVSNAMKYSPPGTTVTLSARRAGADVEIMIADEGTGIAPEALARIFEPYYRTAEATRSAAGMGLGLAVVKALVEAQGGTIAVESAPGRGTRVRVSLPWLPAEAPEQVVPIVS